MKNLESILNQLLDEPVKNKLGDVITDAGGNPITGDKAIAMSLMQKAMKGDLAAASFIYHITHKDKSNGK